MKTTVTSTLCREFLAWLVIPALALTACRDHRLGGMTVNEAFPDREVAAMVAAAARGRSEEVEAAVRNGANVNYVGKQEMTPLEWVMTTRNLEGLEALLRLGADPNLKDSRGYSATWMAAGADDPRILGLILSHRGDPTIVGPRGQSALEIAVEQQREENLRALLRAGADVNQHSEFGESAATTAVAMGRFDELVFILNQGYNYDLQGLAARVEVRVVPAASQQRAWQQKATEMLKARGVSFPAFKPQAPGDRK